MKRVSKTNDKKASKHLSDRIANISDVFISHANIDEKYAETIRVYLESAGTHVFIYEKEQIPGTSFVQMIEEKLKDCSVFIILYSKHSSVSPWVRCELAKAVELNKRIIAVRLDNTPLASGFELPLAGILTLSTDCRAGLNDDTLRQILEGVRSGTNSVIDTPNNRKKPLLNMQPSGLDNEKSWLSDERRKSILEARRTVIPALIDHRKEHLLRLKEQVDSMQKRDSSTRPAWIRVSTTASEKKYRLVMGFRNTTCTYRQIDPLKLGCFNCGFYAGAYSSKAAATGELLQQLYIGLREGFEFGIPFDVIEFLSDGSFLDDSQFSDSIKTKILKVINELPLVKRVLLESRPIHLTSDRRDLEWILEQLRDDIDLEIGVGLETSDDFIRNVCINKGLSKETFEKALEVVSEANRSMKRKRCSIVVYLLVKPAFLSEYEAIEDTLRSLRYLTRMAREKDVDIIPKLEPAAISAGTLLSLQYERNEYAPLNYWSILEILCRASEDQECYSIVPRIRIGAREDMDDVIRVPATYQRDGRFDPFDFVVYDCIQQYNQHNSIVRLVSSIEAVHQSRRESLNHSSSLSDWAGSALGSGKSAILDILRKNQTTEKTPVDPKKIDFLNATFEVLDMLEGASINSSRIIEQIKSVFVTTDIDKRNVALEREILNCYSSNQVRPHSLLSIKIFDVFYEKGGLLRIFFEARDFVTAQSYSIWCGVPIG